MKRSTKFTVRNFNYLSKTFWCWGKVYDLGSTYESVCTCVAPEDRNPKKLSSLPDCPNCHGEGRMPIPMEDLKREKNND